MPVVDLVVSSTSLLFSSFHFNGVGVSEWTGRVWDFLIDCDFVRLPNLRR